MHVTFRFTLGRGIEDGYYSTPNIYCIDTHFFFFVAPEWIFG